MNRFLALALVAALTLTACTGSASTSTTPDSTTTTTGESFAGTDPAPDFPQGLDWINTDQPLTLEQLRGKVVLLDFWTYGCINCIHIIPDLERLEEEYADELVVIGVHSAKFANEGETGNIREIVQRYGIEHPVVNDRDFAIWRTWGASAWPTVVLIDPVGNIVGGRAGEGVYEVFQPVIESLTREFADRIDPTPLELRLEREGRAEGVLSYPGKVAVDSERGLLYVADTNNHRIVVADLATGEIVAVAGSGERGFSDGDLAGAQFDQPQGMALLADSAGVWVADTGNHAVRRVDVDAGIVTTIAGTGEQSPRYPPVAGTATETALASPWDVHVDGDRLFVAMAGSHQIWEIDLVASTAKPYAGSGGESTRNGPRLGAELAQPSGLAYDGERLYFADSESSSIRYVEVDPVGLVGLVAGADSSLFDFGEDDGVGAAARFQHPLGVALDGEGSLFVADTYNSKIRRIDLGSGEVTTLVGGQGWRDGADPLFHEPGGLVYVDGTLYVADTNNHVIRRVDAESGFAETIVLYGIERFEGGAGYQGKVVTADWWKVNADVGALQIDIGLPEGYKLNDIAPMVIELSATGGVVEFEQPVYSLVEPDLPISLPVTWLRGDGEVTADLTIYYCEAEAQELCLVEQVRLVVPVGVGDGGPVVVEARHDIPAP